MEKILWSDEVPELLRKLKSYLDAGNCKEADKVAEYISEKYGLYGTLGSIYEEIHMPERAKEFYRKWREENLPVGQILRKKGMV
jgi:hypothetical protein